MLIPRIEYAVFYPFIDKGLVNLNMTICDGAKVDLSIPIAITNDIDKYNKSSDYYNSVCSLAISDSGTDITLDDRRNEFVNDNMTLCEEDCELTSYNNTNQKAKCSCFIKMKIPLIDEIKFDKKNYMKVSLI